MLETIRQTASYIKGHTNNLPETGIILGTGLSGLAKEIKTELIIPYKDIPNFPISTVESHKGNLIFGILGSKRVVALQGRFHYYEGYSMQQVTFPVRVLKWLGIKNLFVSNASGGLNKIFKAGDLLVINDHINLLPNPLIGKHIPEFGPRFPDMSEPYDKRLIKQALSIAKKNNIVCHTGCYVGVTGPSFETQKEYQYFKTIGGDAVGMSTIPEIIVARQMNVRCFAISIITNLGLSLKKENSLQDVIKAAEQAEPKLTLLIKELVELV